MRSIILCIVSIFICFGCEEVKKLIDDNLTEGEVGDGLKEALTIGCEVASGSASKTDGFLMNELIRIALPPEALTVKNAVDNVNSPIVTGFLTALGFDFNAKLDELHVAMNRAAEESAKTAFNIFAGAVTNMTITDAFGILRADTDTAAMHYMRVNTTQPLTSSFSPIVQQAINTVGVLSYWAPIVNSYNSINSQIDSYNNTMAGMLLPVPRLGNDVNPDLESYIVGKSINGLMLLIGEQEKKIRNDPVAQVTDLLRKVFGNK